MGNNDKPVVNSKLLGFLIYLLFALGPITGNVILVLFLELSVEFNVTPDALLLSIPAFMFPFAIIQLFSGAISDIKGRIPVIFLGLLIFIVGMITALSSVSLELYIIANILAGIGFGFVNPVLIALITDLTEESKIPKKMGYLGAVANLGLGLGPLMAAQFLIVGWRYIYLLFIVIIVVSLILLLLIDKPPRRIDLDSGVKKLFSNIGKELKRPIIILLIAVSFLASHTFLAIIIWTSRSYTGIINESLSGIILAIVGLIGAISGYLSGKIIKRLGPHKTLLIGITVEYAAVIIFLFRGDITQPGNLGFNVLGLFLNGFSVGLLFPLILFFSQTLSTERRGVLAGLATVSQFISVALIPFTYEPAYNFGGISLVYLSIFIVAIIFSIVLLFFSMLSKRSETPQIS